MHCNFEGIQEDTEVSGDSSPKEGKYSSNLNTYMSFINRHNQQREINALLGEVFQKKKHLTLEEYKVLNKNVSSELYCILMALLYNDLPCTKTVHRLKRKFDETARPGSGSASPKLASPKFMPGVIGFVENGGHSPKASNSKKTSARLETN